MLGFLAAVPSAFCFYSAPRNAHFATHFQRFYQKKPDHTSSTPSLITALHMSTERTERSSSRGRGLVPVRGPSSSSNDPIISLSALLNSRSLALAVAARATSVLPPVNLRSTVPKTTPTLAAGSPSLRAIPMW
jgi:hypothetical protein